MSETKEPLWKRKMREKGNPVPPLADDTRQRVTTMAERYTIDCSYCGFITTAKTVNEALETARGIIHRGRHASAQEKITIFDRLAQRGACNLWDTEGHCIGHKEWK